MIFCDLTLIFLWILAVLFWYMMLITTYNHRPCPASQLILGGGGGLPGKKILPLIVDVAGYSWIKS